MEQGWNVERLTRMCHYKKASPDIMKWAFKRLAQLYPKATAAVAVDIIENDHFYLKTLLPDAVKFLTTHPEDVDTETLSALFQKKGEPVDGFIAIILSLAEYAPTLELFFQKFPDLLNDSFKINEYTEVLHAFSTSFKDSETLRNNVLEIWERLPLMEWDSKLIDVVVEISLNLNIPPAQLIAKAGKFTPRKRFYSRVLGGLIKPYLENELPLGFELLQEEIFFSQDDPRLHDTDYNSGCWDLLELYHRCVSDISLILGAPTEDSGFDAMFGKEEYDSIIQTLSRCYDAFLKEKIETVGAEGFQKWRNGQGDVQQLFVLFDLFLHDYKTGFEQNKDYYQKKYIAQALLFLLGEILLYTDTIGIEIVEGETGIGLNLDLPQALEFFFLDRPNVKADTLISEAFHKLDDESHQAVVRQAVSYLEENPRSRANDRIIDLLVKKIDAQLALRLLVVNVSFPMPRLNIFDAVARLGSEAFSVLRQFLQSDCREEEISLQYYSVLEVLIRLPNYEDVVQMMLQYWESFWIYGKSLLLDTIEAVGDRRLIAPLKKELKEGQYFEAKVYLTLCKLNGETGGSYKKIEKAYRRDENLINKRMEYLREGQLDVLLSDPVNLELQCLSCNRTYNYWVENISLFPEVDDFVVNTLIICKNCQELDNYQITPGTYRAVENMKNLILHWMWQNETNQLPEEFVFSFVRISPIDGRILNIRQTCEYYREKVKAEPDNTSLILFLAQSLDRGKRSVEAVRNYQKVIELDPLCVEALASLAINAKFKSQFSQARRLFEEALKIMDTGNYYRISGERHNFKHFIVFQYQGLMKALKQTPPPEMQPFIECCDHHHHHHHH